jgi:hypothetical protein
MRRFLLLVMVGAVWPSVGLAADPPAAVADGLKAIKAVGPEGAGNEEAAKGWKAVVKGGSAALVPTLAAFDDASPLAANWLRSAVNAIVEEEGNAGKVVSKIDLGTFAADRKRNPAARRLAFELLEKVDKAAAAAMLPDFLNDPSADLRRDAIAAGLKDAAPLANVEGQKAAFLKLFAAARDQDQVDDIAKKLKDLGVEQNVTKHYGFVTEWNVSEQFDNKELKGFAVPYPPEKATDRTGWKYAQSWDAYGNVDLNAAVADAKDVLAYAVATVVAPDETKCQVRLASPNAIKLFVNGKEVYFKEEYHSGKKHDQHVANVTLKKGANELLVKVCQNDKSQPYMKPWEFAARVCDATGGALPLKQQITKDGQQVTVDLGELAPAPKKEEKK